MESIYASRVERYGHNWHHPWLVILAFLLALWGLGWLASPGRNGPPPPQVVCETPPGSRFREGVEIAGRTWTGDFEAALACAAKDGRRVFVAFHAVTDTGARANEITVFQNCRVRLALEGYVLVMLYVDLVPDRFYRRPPDKQEGKRDGEANLKFLNQGFQTFQEPLYAVLKARGEGTFDVVARYDEARIRDIGSFVQFLRNPGSVTRSAR